LKSHNRWVTMATLCLSGGTIFMLPFLREFYYIPMQNAFGFSNTELGLLMSAFGVFSLLGYFPGGWLADFFSPRILMSSALFLTGITGVYFSTIPSFEHSLILHAFWGLNMSMVFWNAMIKATRNWAPREEQGRAFGFLEGGRGFTEAMYGSLLGGIFIWLGNSATTMSVVINIYAGANILLAILTWFTLDSREQNIKSEGDTSHKVEWQDVLSVLKMKEVWLISIVIFSAYSGYWGTINFVPFADSAFAMSTSIAVMIGMGKVWLNPVSAVTSGFIGDKIGISRAIFFLLSIIVCVFFIYGIMPYGASMIYFMLIGLVLTAFAAYALRGIYFALLEESGIPVKLTGTAAGVVSVIGFIPDIYVPYLSGVLLDTYSIEMGYRYYYLITSGICLVGATAAFIIMKRTQKRRPKNNG